MTQGYKDLLLKDLCARLPYMVKIHTNSHNAVSPLQVIDIYEGTANGFFISRVKPYLRPMSSMTEEERTEYLNACGNEMDNALSSPRYSGIDYLNANHFDYRGLIPKGLAIEAPEGMYKKGE